MAQYGRGKATATAFGVYAGILGVEHGCFETLQGNVAPKALKILAVSPFELPFPFGHEPAMTIVPSFLVTGILAILVGLAIILWSVASLQSRAGAGILFLPQFCFSWWAEGSDPYHFCSQPVWTPPESTSRQRADGRFSRLCCGGIALAGFAHHQNPVVLQQVESLSGRCRLTAQNNHLNHHFQRVNDEKQAAIPPARQRPPRSPTLCGFPFAGHDLNSWS